MSTLALVVVTGMAVGSGPAHGTTGTRQHFDLHGEWEGTSERMNDDGIVETSKIKFYNGGPEQRADILYLWSDLGKGRCIWVILACTSGGPTYITDGIYKREGAYLVICLKHEDRRRVKEPPVGFKTDRTQSLMTLRRVHTSK